MLIVIIFVTITPGGRVLYINLISFFTFPLWSGMSIMIKDYDYNKE